MRNRSQSVLLVVLFAALFSLAGTALGKNALVVTAYPYFGGTETGTGSYTQGTPVSVVATATNSRYTFAYWTWTDGTATMTNSTLASTTYNMGAVSGTLTAVYNTVITRVPLQISGGFNMDCLVGPREATQASASNLGIIGWQGTEKQGIQSTNGSNN